MSDTAAVPRFGPAPLRKAYHAFWLLQVLRETNERLLLAYGGLGRRDPSGASQESVPGEYAGDSGNSGANS